MAGKSRNWEARCAGLALARIGDLGLAPTPNAYGVFYTYFDAQNAALRKEVDALAARNANFNDDLVNELYDRYCGRREEVFTATKLAGTVADELGRLLTIVSDAGRNTSAYQTTLETASTRLGKNLGAGDVRDIVDRVLVETQAVVARSRELEHKLVDSASTIDDLSQELHSLRREAITDPLTGLANRGEFQRFLEEAMNEAKASGTRFSLLIADIDHFKRVNDTFGHTVGDKVLKLTASTIGKNVKGKDLAARYGGEEFGVVLAETSLVQASRFAETLRVAVSAQSIVRRNTGERQGTVTISIGVAEFTDDDAADALIDRADRALYLAKNRGRNRVCTELDLDETPESTDSVVEAVAAG